MLKLPTSREGNIVRNGVRVHWQLFGDGPTCILLLPTWAIVHSDFWRHQVPFFSDRYTVVAFDGRGNGASDRPTTAEAYSDEQIAADAIAVLDAIGIRRALSISVSAGALWALHLAAHNPDRISASIFIAPSLPLSPPLAERAAALAVFDQPQSSHEGWLKCNRHYWLSNYRDFLEFFFSKCFTEPDSASHIDHFVQMGLETTPQTLLLTTEAPSMNRELCERLARAVIHPTLVLHGTDDAITPFGRGEALAVLTKGRFVALEGSGHEPQCRVPQKVNPIIGEFLEKAR
jgi:pimeloyl-ACP methyl ester carboxylesterase